MNPEEEIKKLQDTIKTMQGNMEQMSDYINKSSVIISTIAENKDLMNGVKKAISGEPVTPPQPHEPPKEPVKEPPKEPATPPQPPKDPKVDNMDLRMREDIIREVENKYGYDQLPAEKRKELRQKVEARLNRYGLSVVNAPVNALTTYLDDAYLLESIPQAKEDGKLEGLIEARSQEYGALPSMGGGQPKAEENELKEDHRKWAEKLDVPLDKVQKNLKELAENGVISYKPPEKEKKQDQNLPSGQPKNT